MPHALLKLRHHPGDPPADIMELLVTIHGLRGERNALIHGLWSFGEPGTAIVQTIKLDRSPVVNGLVATVAGLDELTVVINEARDALRKLGRRLGFPRIPPGHPPIIKQQISFTMHEAVVRAIGL